MSGGRAPRDAGDRFERAVVAYLRAHGFPYAERAYGAGRPDDVGDIDGIPGIAIQCRALRRIGLSEGLEDAERQAGRDRFGVVIFKRRNHSTGRAYVVMSLETFAELEGEP